MKPLTLKFVARTPEGQATPGRTEVKTDPAAPLAVAMDAALQALVSKGAALPEGCRWAAWEEAFGVVELDGAAVVSELDLEDGDVVVLHPVSEPDRPTPILSGRKAA